VESKGGGIFGGGGSGGFSSRRYNSPYFESSFYGSRSNLFWISTWGARRNNIDRSHVSFERADTHGDKDKNWGNSYSNRMHTTPAIGSVFSLSYFFSATSTNVSRISSTLQKEPFNLAGETFSCSNGRVVPAFVVCDLVNDCDDMSDERSPSPCSGVATETEQTLFIVLGGTMFFLSVFATVLFRYLAHRNMLVDASHGKLTWDAYRQATRKVASVPGVNGLVTPGARVQTKFSFAEGGDGRWYKASVKTVWANGDASLEYDDGDKWRGHASEVVLLDQHGIPIASAVSPGDGTSSASLAPPAGNRAYGQSEHKAPSTLVPLNKPGELMAGNYSSAIKQVASSM
jgi:hypothetical protein